MEYFDRLADEQDMRREAREPARIELERKLQNYNSANLSELELVARDVIREAHFERSVADEQRMSARSDLQALRASLPQPLTPAETRTKGTMLPEVLGKLAAERGYRAKSRDTYAAAVGWFYDRVGLVAVEQITRKDVLAFKDKLLAEGTTPANINTKLSRIAAILSYGVVNDIIDANPALGIKVADTKAPARKRLPFSAKDLAAIFAGPVHANGERPTAGKGEAAYWIPLLSLYTGARLEELGQLRPDDIEEVSYLDMEDKGHKAWVISIAEAETEGLLVKNAGSIRKVPIHQTLIDLGFLKYVEAAKAANGPRIFPALKPDKYGKDTAKFGEWFTSYRQDVCGVTDTRLVFHSFRHAFADNARHSGMIDGAVRQIMGHAGEGVADKYGTGHGFFRLVEAMSVYRVPGFVPPAPSPKY